MTKSKFLKKTKIAHYLVEFEAWLVEGGYFRSAEGYPGAVLADTLVHDYFREFTDRRNYRHEVDEHAGRIGWLSDANI